MQGVKGMSMSSRYECTVCRNHFCIDCDLFAHEIVHNCPGCQSTAQLPGTLTGTGEERVGEVNGHPNGVVSMDVR